MALLKKLHSEWYPSENKGLKVGETIEMDSYRELVESGMAELVDETGNVLPLPGTVFVCGICFAKIDDHDAYIDHVYTAHQIAKRIEPEVLEDELEVIDNTEHTQAKTEPTGETWGQKMARLRAEKKAREGK